MIAFFFMAGCSLSQEQFQTESIDVTCTRLMECYAEEAVDFFEFESQDACISALRERLQPTTNCVYDSEKAQICLDEKYDSTCESYSFDDSSDACEEAVVCEDSEEEEE